MTDQRPLIRERWLRYTVGISFAAIAVLAALGAFWALTSVPVLGVKAVEESGEMPVEERPPVPVE